MTDAWKSGKTLLLGILALLSCAGTAWTAERLPMKPFSYHEGFENSDPVQFRPLFLIA